MINNKKIYIILIVIIIIILILIFVCKTTIYNTSRLNKNPYSLNIIEESINLNSSRSNVF